MPTRARLPPCAMLAVSTRPRTPRFKHDKNQPTMPQQMQAPPSSQPPLANAALGLRLTVHENTHKTAWRPTTLPIYPRKQPSALNKPPMLTESAHENAPTDGIQRWGPSTRTQCHSANQDGIQYPLYSEVRTPHLPLMPEWQPKRQRPLQWGHHCIPLDHGCRDHMLTPRCAETLLSTVRILGGYISGSRSGSLS